MITLIALNIDQFDIAAVQPEAPADLGLDDFLNQGDLCRLVSFFGVMVFQPVSGTRLPEEMPQCRNAFARSRRRPW